MYAYGKSITSIPNRYLIKQQGEWKILTTYASFPNWDNDVTDVIWLKNHETMIASWWHIKDSERMYKTSVRVQDEELSFIMLQVKNV